MAILDALPPEKLRQRCAPDQFTFETTAELEVLEGLIGQKRAVEAVQFGNLRAGAFRLRRRGCFELLKFGFGA